MSRIRTLLGIARSLVIYHGMPGRRRSLDRLYGEFLGPGDLAFDVGAHVGSRVGAWRRLGARVVAVEPQPACLDVLRGLYGRDPGVVIVPCALGAAPGAADLLVSRIHPTVSTLGSDWARRVGTSPGFRQVRWDERQRVEVTTLDALIGRHGVPAFVKVDVEGWEGEVLSGLTRALAALSVECLPADPAPALAALGRLRDLGEYRFNWSPGESLRLAWPQWGDAAMARAFLRGLRPGEPSGDLYARLEPVRHPPSPATAASPRAR